MRTATFKKLMRDLSSPDVSRRRAVVQALAETDERAIYPLIKALRDPNPGVQDAAMRSLMAIGGELAAYMVLPLLREDSYLRNTALLILRDIGSAAVPLLYPLLLDKDEDMRKFSVDLLAEIKDGVLPEKIMPLAKDPNANVRAAAVRAVGALMHKDGAGEVTEALGDEEWVCFSALDTLGRLKDEGAVDAITGLLSSPSEALRVEALDTLGRIGSTRAGDAIVRMLPGLSGEEKNAAVRSLVQIGIPPGMDKLGDCLIEMFGDSEWEGKLIALRGLLELREARAVSVIVDMAGSLDPSVPEEDERLAIIKRVLREFGCVEEFVKVLADPGMRYRGKAIAAETVAHMGCAEAIPNLIELYDTSKRDVKRACIKALGNMEDKRARETVMRALSDADGHIRRAAAASLGRTGGDEAFGRLIRHIEEEQYADVMEEAVKSLFKIDPTGFSSRLGGFPARVREAAGRHSEDPDILLGLSGDEDPEVRVAALAGLGKLGGPKARERITGALRDRESEVRRAAVIALGGSEFAPEDIVPMLSDGDVWVRLHAVGTLGRSGRQDAVDVLRTAVGDAEMPVMLAAVEAIAAIGGERGREALLSLADHPEEAVRDAARQAREAA